MENPIPITVNYNHTKPPIGKIEFVKGFKFPKDCIIAPGYVENDDGTIDLIEMSLIDGKNLWREKINKKRNKK